MEKFVILIHLQSALTAVFKKLREWIEKQRYVKGPSSDGEEGQVLTTNGKGVRTWTTVEAAGAAASAMKEAKSYTDKVAEVKLDAEKLPEAIDEALAKAKESGAFDGPQGEQGEPGPQGPQGEQGPPGEKGDNADLPMPIPYSYMPEGYPKETAAEIVPATTHDWEAEMWCELQKATTIKAGEIYRVYVDELAYEYVAYVDAYGLVAAGTEEDGVMIGMAAGGELDIWMKTGGEKTVRVEEVTVTEKLAGRFLDTKAVVDAVEGELENRIDESVSAALTEAKESGEFDGPQGPQGEPGPQGEKGEKGEKGDPGDGGTEAFVVNCVASGIDGSLTLESMDKTFAEMQEAISAGKDVRAYVSNSIYGRTDVFTLAQHSDYLIQFTHFNETYYSRLVVNEAAFWIGSWQDDKGSTAVYSHNTDETAHADIREKLENKLDASDLDWLPVNGLVVLAEEKTITNSVGSDPTETTGGFPDLTISDVTVGMSIVVVWDGVEYPVTVMQSGSVVYAGNYGFFGGTDTGEPFLLMFGDSVTSVLYMDGVPHVASVLTEIDNPIPKDFLTEHNADPESHTDIRAAVEAAKMPVPIPYSYVPEGYPKKEKPVILPETTFYSEYGMYVKVGTGNFIVDKHYTITIDSVAYPTVALVAEDGTVNLVTDDVKQPAYSNENGEIYVVAEVGTHTVSIELDEPVITPMAEEFLPDSALKAEDLTEHNADPAAHPALRAEIKEDMRGEMLQMLSDLGLAKFASSDGSVLYTSNDGKIYVL